MRKTFFLILTLLFSLPAYGQARAQDFFFKNDQQYENIRIVRVLSANRVLLENEEVITLIGLKAPDLPGENRREKLRDEFGFIIETTRSPYDSLEFQALEYVKTLLENKTVRLEFDNMKSAGDYSTLAYVFLPDGKMANTEILRQGYASLTIEPRNKKYIDQLRAAYQEAREERRGLAGE